MTGIDFHADDYALSEHSDNDILALCLKGKLDGISIMVNMRRAPEAVKRLRDAKFPHPVRASIHLNFMEGYPCAKKEEVKDLVDDKGLFHVSWRQLVLWSCNPVKRNHIRKQLAMEINAQIEKAILLGIADPKHLRLDSHQHPHMIPIVFDALIDVIKQHNYGVDYIRNSEDPIRFYGKHPSLYRTLRPVNLVKCMILNHYSRHVKHVLQKMRIPATYLCGVCFSGHMDTTRIRVMIPDFLKAGDRHHRPVEFLFHPGTMLKDEQTEEFTKLGFNDFHFNEGRRIEYRTVEEVNS